MAGGRGTSWVPSARAGSASTAAGLLVLAALSLLVGCSRRALPEAITRVDRVHRIPSDAEPVAVPAGSEILAWIERAVVESQAYRSQFCFRVWLFSADTDIGDSLIIVSHEALSDEIPYFSLLVMTTGNPAIAYRYRIKPEDADEFSRWIDGIADE